MTELPVTEAREHLADVVNQVAYSGEGAYLTRRGRRLAAIVPVEVLEAIERLEDQIDIQAAEESYAEAGQDKTLAQLREELRLRSSTR
jgi:prevent-host-death family protein